MASWKLFLGYFALVYLATNQFLESALPGRSIVVPTQVVIYLLLLFQVIPFVTLFAVDRLIAARFSRRALIKFRAAAYSGCGILFLRQLDLYPPGKQIVAEIESLSAFLAAGLLVTLAGAIAYAAVRHQRVTQLGLYYFGLPALVLTGTMLTHDAVDNGDFRGYGLSEVSRFSGTREAPVFVLVFDMLAYEALLAPDGSIDNGRFPNFSRLASDGVWATNATSSVFATGVGVPELMDAVLALGDRYDIRLYSQTPWVESLFSKGCGREYTCRGARYLTLSDKLGLTEAIARRALSSVVGLSLRAPADTGDTHIYSPRIFDVLIRDVDSEGSLGRLHFFHTHLPHDPFVFDRDGVTESPGVNRFDYDSSTAPDAATFAVLWDKYRDQIEYLDGLLGAFVDELEKEGIYDEAVIILTADHGLRSAYPGGEFDPIIVDSLVTRIPFLMKAPGLQPKQVSTDYQHIDFGPTLYEILGAEHVQRLPQRASLPLGEGVSWFASDRPNRAKEFFVTWRDSYWRYVLDETSQTWQLTEPPKEMEGPAAHGQ
jgi:hypothetical protein